ncbi:uncharacterized protein [Nicotiana tomentosiformis]|uniref:uncharacterized protein n=1 Tax=Nicotiana tomentosiformis TaxID=4098 RepID=UPI00388C69F6
MAIANNMQINGEKLEDVTIIEKILRSMTAKFNYIVFSIEESKDIDTLSIDELQSSLLVHEQKLNQQDKEELGLKTTTFSKGEDHEKETKAEEEVSLLMAYTSREKVSANLWYLDTGCNNHMYGHKVAFSELDETFQDTVKFGDNSAVSIVGKGKKEMVLGMPQFEPPNGICEECVVSKQHRESFPTSKSWRAKKVLELVH